MIYLRTTTVGTPAFREHGMTSEPDPQALEVGGRSCTPKLQSAFSRSLPAVVAVMIVTALFFLSQPPRLSQQTAEELAGRFQFQRFDLPVISKKTPKAIREVHASLAHLANWISFVGAAVGIGDLDGNGLSDDLVYVDPRYDEITVCPVPGTGERYAPFLLQQQALPYETRSTAPMGTLLGDFNEDGVLDILVYFWGRSPILYLSRLESTAGSKLSLDAYRPVELVSPSEVWHTSAMTQADLDGDGHIDLVVGNYNPDNARTLDPTDTEGQAEQMMGSWGRATNGGKTRLMISTGGSGRSSPMFVEAKDVLATEVSQGWTFAVGAADLDGDMRPEIYLVNDFGADRLLHNLSTPGHPEFRLLTGRRSLTSPRSMSVGMDSFNGMGIDFADINSDGRMDFIVSNITSDYGLHQSNLVFVQTDSTSLMQDGVAPFTNRSEEFGLSRGGWTWDTKFADFDNNGVLELMQATGFMNGTINRWPEFHELGLANEELAKYPLLYPQLGVNDGVSQNEHNPFFARHEDRYYDIAEHLGEEFSKPMMSRGLAMSDVDGDGRIDFAVANNWGPSFYFHNEASGVGKFLGLHVRLALDDSMFSAAENSCIVRSGHPDSIHPTLPAIGAQATIHIHNGNESRSMISQVGGGNGHSGQRSPDLHFGLGDIPTESRVDVALRWRDYSGEINKYVIENVKPGWKTVLLRGGSHATN